MPSLDHLIVSGFSDNQPFQSTFTPRGPALIQRDRGAHGQMLLSQLRQLKLHAAALTQRRKSLGIPDGVGMTIAVRVARNGGLDLKSIEWARDRIEVLSVAEVGSSQVVAIHVPDGKLAAFEKRITEYLTQDTNKGHPKNARLVTAIEAFRKAAFSELWTGTSALPAADVPDWMQIWVRLGSKPATEVVSEFSEAAARLDILIEPGYLTFPGRVVVCAYCTKTALENAIALLDVIAEIRPVMPTAEFYLSDLTPRDQAQWITDLVQRTSLPASGLVPYVTLLDTGVNHAHPLLQDLVSSADVHAIKPEWGGADEDGHGTGMAGIVCYGNLVSPISSSTPLTVPHRMESVKILPPQGENPPHLYGWVAATAVNTVEQVNPERRRVYAMMTTAIGATAGMPSEWSATMDQMAFGLNGLNPYNDGQFPPIDNRTSRLFVMSAGNIPWTQWDNYPTRNYETMIEDPGQSWNSLTVGAYTNLATIDAQKWPGLTPIAMPGSLGPASTTSVMWESTWPLKPDVVAEGGNGSTDLWGISVGPESLRVLTTSNAPHVSPLTETGDTSAAAAEVARICAHLRARYPSYWEETIRALVVHGARFTPQMRSQLPAHPNKSELQRLQRTYGFGKADLANSIDSQLNAPTLVAQEYMVPYVKGASGVRLNELRLHELPWPKAELEALGGAEVEMRVTLSYFVEPNPSRRGWQSKFRYQSHALRFAVKGAAEEEDRFLQRINKINRLEAVENEELDADESLSDPDRLNWTFGARLRSKGSLHSDTWTGSAAALANKSHIAVFPVGGWWKDWKDSGRVGESVRYALIVSLHVADGLDVDLYTPIKNAIATSVAIDIDIAENT